MSDIEVCKRRWESKQDRRCDRNMSGVERKKEDFREMYVGREDER